jgi:serine/threonine protein kinase
MKLRDKYEKLEKIGQGSFGKVFKVRNRATKEFLCLKEIDLSLMGPKMRRDAENEVKILKTMDHEYILGFVESFKAAGIFRYFFGFYLFIFMRNYLNYPFC